MLCDPDEIENFHGKLASSIDRSVIGKTVIDQHPNYWSNESWKKTHHEGPVSFSLWARDQRMQAQERGKGRPIQQLREVGGGDTGYGWLSWHEQWHKESGDELYELLSAGMAFYWGDLPYPFMMFRAEWGRIGDEPAAHPHWHADCALIDAELKIERIHLGMGGWNHAEAQCACWQVVPDDTDEIHDWAVKTVEYCRQQLEHYPPN